jgi:nucleoside-diphosphate-sugar epimerase
MRRSTALRDPTTAPSILLTPTVHGEGDTRGFISILIGIARATGVSAVVGSNRWPSVHRRDAATLFRLAVESAPAGTRLKAVAEEGCRFGTSQRPSAAS